jgi:hypothetical protein
MSRADRLDGVLIQWGDRLFYPANTCDPPARHGRTRVPRAARPAGQSLGASMNHLGKRGVRSGQSTAVDARVALVHRPKCECAAIPGGITFGVTPQSRTREIEHRRGLQRDFQLTPAPPFESFMASRNVHGSPRTSK